MRRIGILGTWALALVVSTSTAAQGTWHWEAPLPQGQSLHDIWANGPEDVWMVGESGAVLHWDGSVWSNRSPQYKANLISFEAVWGSSSTDVYAAGDHYLGEDILYHWNGSGWDEVATGQAEMTGITGSGPSDVYVCNTGSAVAHWDGYTWSRISPEAWDEAIPGIWCAGPRTLYVLYDEGIWLWKNSTWSLLSGCSAYPRDICGSAEGDFYVLENDYPYSQYVRHWDGSGWTVVLNDPDLDLPRLNALGGSTDGGFFAAGDDGAIFRLTPGGSERMHGGTFLPLHAIGITGPGSGFAVGPYGVVVQGEDGVWTSRFSGTDERIRAVTGNSSGQVVACGEMYQLLQRSDSGWLRWPASVVDAVGESDESVYLVSEDGAVCRWDGSGWNGIPTDPSWAISSAWLDEAGRLVVGASSDGFRGGLVARWDGTEWTSLLTGTEFSITDVDGTSSTDLYALELHERIHHWDGSAWTVLDVPDPNAYNLAFEVFDSGSIAVARSNGPEVLLHDGTDWTEIHCSFSPKEVWGVSETQFWVAGDSSYNGLICAWDGSDWTIEHHLPNSILLTLFGRSDQRIWAGGENGSLLERVDGQWQEIPTGLGATFRAIWVSDTDRIYGGTQSSHAASRSAVVRCDGAGCLQDWQVPSPRDYQDVDTTEAGDAIAITSQEAHHWNGVGWEIHPLPDETWDAIWAGGPAFAVAVGGAGRIAHWDGSTWFEVESGTSEYIRSVRGRSETDVYATDQSGGLLHWDGGGWSRSVVAEVGGDAIYDVLPCPGGELYITTSSCVYRSTGSGWDPMPIESSSSLHLRSLGGCSPSDLFVAASTGCVYRWDGAGWSPEASGDPGTVEDLWTDDAGALFVTCSGGLVSNRAGPPTPTPGPLGVRLDLPPMAHPHQPFWVTGFLDNPGAPLEDVPVFFVLEVAGRFWFWDSWALYDPPEHTSIDMEYMDVPTGSTEVIVLPTFTWPDTGQEAAQGLYFYGAMLNSGMSEVRGQLAAEEWGYGP